MLLFPCPLARSASSLETRRCSVVSVAFAEALRVSSWASDSSRSSFRVASCREMLCQGRQWRWDWGWEFTQLRYRNTVRTEDPVESVCATRTFARVINGAAAATTRCRTTWEKKGGCQTLNGKFPIAKVGGWGRDRGIIFHFVRVRFSIGVILLKSKTDDPFVLLLALLRSERRQNNTWEA